MQERTQQPQEPSFTAESLHPQGGTRGRSTPRLPRASYRIRRPDAPSKRGALSSSWVSHLSHISLPCSAMLLGTGTLTGQAQAGRGLRQGTRLGVRPQYGPPAHSLVSPRTSLTKGKFQDQSSKDLRAGTLGALRPARGPSVCGALCRPLGEPQSCCRQGCKPGGQGAEGLEAQGETPEPQARGWGPMVPMPPARPKVPTYHPPPQGVRVAAELHLAGLIDSVLLGQVHEVGGEDEAQEADVQRGDQLLRERPAGWGQPGAGAPVSRTHRHGHPSPCRPVAAGSNVHQKSARADIRLGGLPRFCDS